VGSFLNVVAIRYNSGLGFTGRSSCPVCAHTLRWWELVPIFSWILLQGRCSKCKTRISPQYPLVEILTGLVFATVSLIYLPVFCIYIIILVYDLRHKIIPDPLVYLAIVLSLLFWNLFAGLIIFLFFASVWLLSRGRAIGFGDAKLGLSIGLMLGLSQGSSAIILAFWIGAVFGILLLIRSKNITMKNGNRITLKSELPFAPFLILGSWLSLILGLDLLHVSYFL